MTPRIALLVTAGLLLMIGLGFGLTTVNAGLSGNPVSCGSALMPNDDEAESEDRVDYYSSGGEETDETVEDCDRERGDRQPMAYGALGLGVVAGLMSFVVPVKRD